MAKRRQEDVALEFASPHDVPVPYMQRLKDYYLALGYGNPYRWAQYEEVPFTKSLKPLSDTKVGLGLPAPLSRQAKAIRVLAHLITPSPNSIGSMRIVSRETRMYEFPTSAMTAITPRQPISIPTFPLIS